MRSVILSAAKNLLFVACAATPAYSQTLASRISQAPDGIVRMQIDSRMGVCGNGRDAIGYRNAFFANNFQSIGHWSSPSCTPGPLRVTLSVEHGQVTQVRTQVGGAWRDMGERVTDFGSVPPAEASTFFFSLVPRLESASNKDRLLLPAVLPDGVPVVQPLLTLARDENRTRSTRRAAIQWLGLMGDASVVPVLVQFARAGGSDDDSGKSDKMGLGDGAVAALSMIEDDAGIPALIDLAQNGSVSTRRSAVFWLGQNDQPRAMRALHGIIENGNEVNKVRAHAIFALSHGGDTPGSEFAYLRSVYAKLGSDELKESIIQGIQVDESDAGGKWLIERAMDSNESSKLRKSAVFWAGQREATPTADLVRVYNQSQDANIREHAIFVLSQRHDDASIDALMRIARDDKDNRMRSKALFWLGQKDDPRAKKLIADLILK